MRSISYLPFYLCLSSVAGLAIRRANELPQRSSHVSSRNTQFQSRDATAGAVTLKAGFFMTDVTVGSSIVTSIIDSGSSDTWFLSSSSTCNGSPCSHDFGLYDPPADKQQQGLSLNINYGDGSNDHGDVYFDKLCVGQTCTTMDLASAQQAAFTNGQTFSGLVGFGKMANNRIQSNDPNKKTLFMDAIHFDGVNPMMALQMGPATDGTSDGHISFGGGISPDRYKGPLQSVSTKGNPEWQADADITAGPDGKSLGPKQSIIMDTGSNFISLPDAMIKEYFSTVAGAQQNPTSPSEWLVPCDTQLPDLTFNFGNNQNFVVSGKQLLEYSPSSTTNGNCQRTPMIMASTTPIMGNVAFVDRFTIWNLNDESVSWADNV